MISRRDFLASIPLAASLPALARAATAPRNPVGAQMNAWQINSGDFATLLRHAQDLKRLGYEGFECNVRYVEGQFDRGRKAREELRATGVRFYAPHNGLQLGLERLRRNADGAAALGAERFVLSGGGAKILQSDNRVDEKALAKKVETINRLGKHCRQAGLRLVYHNHTAEFAAGGAEIEQLLRQTDPELVWLIWDIGHAWREKTDLAAFFARHHQRIDALHLRDIRGDKQVPLGQGQIDLAALAAEVRKAGWSGWLITEEESLKSTDERLVESVLQSDRLAMGKLFGV